MNENMCQKAFTKMVEFPPISRYSNSREKMGDSDSENEGSQTNVNRLVIRPPGHTGESYDINRLSSDGERMFNGL